MAKKLPSKISTEDLLRALENQEADESTEEIAEIFDYKNDVPLFLSTYGISAGPNNISRWQLKRLYTQFSKAPASLHEFSYSCFKFLNVVNTHTFGINLTKEQIEAFVHAKNRYNNRYSIANEGTRIHFEKYLEDNKIQKGNKWIEVSVLMYIYKKWCKNTGTISRFKPKSFQTMLNLFLDTKVAYGGLKVYKVDESVLTTLTEEEIRKITDEREKRLEEHRKSRRKDAKKGF